MTERRIRQRNILLFALLAAAHCATSAETPAGDPQRLFDEHCTSCHNTLDWAGGLSLDAFELDGKPEQTEAAEKIIAKMRAGMMPPYGKPRPARAELVRVAKLLEARIDHASAAAGHHVAAPGPHRLNRQEYANAIRDLLAIEIDPASYLPVDDSSFGFDNMAGTLGSSPALVNAYVSAASKISRLALGHDTEPKMVNYQAAADYSQDSHVEGLPFGTRGGLKVRHFFAADGEYVFNWTPVRTNAGGMFGNTRGEKLELRIDGKLIRVFDLDEEVLRNAQEDKHEVRVPVTAGLRTVGLTFVSLNDAPNDDLNAHFERTTLTQNLDGFSFSPHVNSMSIAGPYDGRRPARSESRDRILVCKPASTVDEPACARTIFTSLLSRAFRRPVTETDLATPMRLFALGRERNGDFESGIQLGLQMVLADPQFIYRTEPVAVPVSARLAALTDVQLASRLAFFLWSSIPDEPLLAQARAGKLSEPRVLEQQVRRMLADPRSEQLVRNFVGQWLQLRNLDAAAPVADLFPDFDDNLRRDMRREVELLVESILREDRNIAELLDCNYTFLNERLARHYGIPGVYGSHFRRVELTPAFDARRGLLGKAAILTVTSNADRTSTIRRGQWVDINILGTRPPDPPPNTPGLAAEEGQSVGKKRQTLRQRMTEHATNPACASCHQAMDPIGFAMESFDAIGKVRTLDGGQPIDLTGWLVDGTKFEGVSQLRGALIEYSPEFLQTMTVRLMTYALGRGVEYQDMPVVRSVLREAHTKGDRFSELVLAVVRSEPFRNNPVQINTAAR